MTTDEIAQHHFTAGRGKVAQHVFARETGKRGNYYYRVYVRAFNKAEREAAQIKTDSFVAENSTLVDLLRRETESLRVQYIEKVEKWAFKAFARLQKLAASEYPKHSDYITAEMKPYTNAWREAHKSLAFARNARDRARRIVNAGEAAYVKGERKNAEDHYQASIIKLALRIEKKGLDKSKLTVKTAHVGVNIETTLTDGTLTVRAFTIIASGPIQRPHYRYLIK